MPALLSTPPVHSVRRTLAAGAAGVTVIEVPGTLFRITDATGLVSVKLDDAGAFPMSLGMAYECPAGTWFRRIEVANLSAEENTVEILVTNGRIIDDRLNWVRERGAIQAYEPPTRVVGSSQSLAANGTITVTPDLAAGDLLQKGVIVSNGDGSNLRIQVRDAEGNPFSIILPGESGAYPVSGVMQIHNPNPSPVQIYWGRVLWIS